jgi:hypothetical protein
MAVIECLFNYDENTGQVSIETHILEIDKHDKIQFVSNTPGLALESEDGFAPLNLKKGELAPVRHTQVKIPAVNGGRLFKIQYHGPQGHFACGYLDKNRKFVPWPNGVGQGAPGTNP